MKRIAIRLSVGVAIVAAIAMPGAASASGLSVSTRELALMPLPLAAYGTGVVSLPIAEDSGVVTNAEAAGTTNEGVGAGTLDKLGRLTGYTLDYGSKIPGGTGVTEVQTTVEAYKSGAAANAGLAFWRKDDADVDSIHTPGLTVTIRRLASSGVGASSFGDSGSVIVKGEPPVYGADVGFRSGTLVAQVSITASSSAIPMSLAQAAAEKLRARIRAVLAGTISGRPVALPAKPKAGPPAHGPNPEALALTAAEVGGTLAHQGYELDSGLEPLSEFGRTVLLPGDAGLIQDQVTVFRSAAQAQYELTILTDFASSSSAAQSSGVGTSVRSFVPRRVAIPGGDDARALLGLARLDDGKSIYLAFILLRVGSVIEYISVATPSSIKLEPSALAQLAGLAITRAAPHVSKIPIA